MAKQSSLCTKHCSCQNFSTNIVVKGKFESYLPSCIAGIVLVFGADDNFDFGLTTSAILIIMIISQDTNIITEIEEWVNVWCCKKHWSG